MNKCILCQTEFVPKVGTYGKFCSLSCSAKYGGKLRKQFKKDDYMSNPKHCKFCNTVINFENRHNTFCNTSCASSFNNKRKDWSKIKTGPAPKGRKTIRQKTSNGIEVSNAIGPHTVIYLCTCKFTGKKWYATTVKTIHPSHVITKRLYSYQCRFTFSIRSYPDYFSYAIPLIEEHGWYSAVNNGNNLSGCSRDHLYSVSEGYKNSIDPSIISHPANCKIILHTENQKKNSKSSITLEELHKRIAEFEKMYPSYARF